MIDIRDHGGIFGAGKYRKDMEIDSRHVEVLYRSGEKVIEVYPGDVNSVGDHVSILMGTDGYIYGVGRRGVSKFDKDLKLIERFMFTVALNGNTVVDAFLDDDLNLYTLMSAGSEVFGRVTKWHLPTKQLVFDKVYNSVYYVGAQKIVVDKNKNIYFTSSAYDETGAILKLSPTGVIVWTVNPGVYYMRGLEIDSTGEIYVSGSNHAASSVKALAKYSPEGVLRWMTTTSIISGVAAMTITKGDSLYVREFNRQQVMKINTANGSVVFSREAKAISSTPRNTISVDEAEKNILVTFQNSVLKLYALDKLASSYTWEVPQEGDVYDIVQNDGFAYSITSHYNASFQTLMKTAVHQKMKLL